MPRVACIVITATSNTSRGIVRSVVREVARRARSTRAPGSSRGCSCGHRLRVHRRRHRRRRRRCPQPLARGLCPHQHPSHFWGKISRNLGVHRYAQNAAVRNHRAKQYHVVTQTMNTYPSEPGSAAGSIMSGGGGCRILEKNAEMYGRKNVRLPERSREGEF